MVGDPRVCVDGGDPGIGGQGNPGVWGEGIIQVWYECYKLQEWAIIRPLMRSQTAIACCYFQDI